MKKLPWTDISFIILSAIVLIIINHFAGADALGKYALVVALTGFFIGKFVGRRELKRKAI